MFTVIFTQAARTELIDAQDWYEREAAGLGRHFREAIDALTERLNTNPQQFPIVFKNVRRALLRRFPYPGGMIHADGSFEFPNVPRCHAAAVSPSLIAGRPG